MIRREILLPLGALGVAALLTVAALYILQADTPIAAAVVGALIALYGPVIAALLDRYFERQRDTEQRRRDREAETIQRRTPVAEKFIGIWMGLLTADKVGKPAINKAGQMDPQLQREYFDVTEKLMLWGSDEVVQNWGKLRAEFARLGEGGTKEARLAALLKFEDVLMDLRRDVGYPDTDLRRGDLLRLFITDIDDLL